MLAARPTATRLRRAVLIAAALCACSGGGGGGGAGGGQPPPGPPPAPPLDPATHSTDELLLDGVARGVITAEAGLLYRVYDRFAPAKVPAPYRGSQPPVGNLVMLEAAQAFATLSPAGRGALIPFFMPPAYAGSWGDPRVGARARSTATPAAAAPGPLVLLNWTSQETADVKIWRNTDDPSSAAAAANVLAALDAALPPVRALMGGRTHPDDSGPHPFVDIHGQDQLWGDGGNGKWDIYITPFKENGLTVAYPPGCSERPSFTVLDSGKALDPMKARNTVAHEYMHVLQNTYLRGSPCREYEAFDEGVANYAMHRAFPADNWEHDWNRYAKNEMTIHNAGCHLWPLSMYLVETRGPTVLHTVYSAMGVGDPWKAVDASLGWRSFYPDFVVRMWNQTPGITEFKDWDAFTAVPVTPAHVEVQAATVPAGRVARTYTLESLITPPLSRDYFHFTIADPTIRSMTFENIMKFRADAQRFVFKAIVKKAGVWTVEDWTAQALDGSKEICLDLQKDRIEEVVLALSNADLQPESFGAGFDRNYVTFSRVGCWQYAGTTDARTVTHDVERTATMTAHATVTFQAESYAPWVGRLNLKSGTMTWTYSGTDRKGCSTGNLSGAAALPAGSGSLGADPFATAGVFDSIARGYLGGLISPAVTVHYSCPQRTQDYDLVVGLALMVTPMLKQAADDGSFVGDGGLMTGDADVTTSWNLTPQRE